MAPSLKDNIDYSKYPESLTGGIADNGRPRIPVAITVPQKLANFGYKSFTITCVLSTLYLAGKVTIEYLELRRFNRNWEKENPELAAEMRAKKAIEKEEEKRKRGG